MSEPVDVFIGTLANCTAMVEKIENKIGAHLDAHPDEVSWANVGDADRLLTDLMAIVEYLHDEKRHFQPVKRVHRFGRVE